MRFVALKVLTLYWHLLEYWDTARDVLEHDPDVECRFRAASDMGVLMMNTQDQRTLAVLARVIRNEQEGDVVHSSAYAAMQAVLHYDPREQVDLMMRNWKKVVDWQIVDSYL